MTTDSQKRNRVRVEYGQDGSLESRLYLTGAGKDDTGRYSCHIPGLSQVAPASVNLHITQGEIGDKDKGNAQMLAMKLKG